MMGRGAEGGSHQLVGFPSVYSSKIRPQSLGLDIYSQVLKALSVKNTPRDDVEHPVSGALPMLTAPLTLKISASIDSKRKSRAKKAETRSRESGPASKKRQYGEDSAAGDSAAGHFWTQMEDYFRDVTTSDIQLLLPTTDFDFSEDCTLSDPCLLIPPLGRHYTEKWAEEDAKDAETATLQIKTRVKRKTLAPNPVSKKIKKSIGELITTIISPPPENEDEDELCHVCNGGDSDESNAILFCDTCNVAVHQDCYGVRSVPEGQWLCSWCSREATRTAEGVMRECMLCPVVGGALKPVVEVDSKGSSGKKCLKFAHLFCSQWVPETYIGNMEAMEPIRNVEGVRDERWRLLCSICKEKQGACIQCSHGMCATAFHPLCARKGKLYMEVSSRQDCEDVELRAYCSKHSAARLAKVSLSGSEGVDGSNAQALGDEDLVKISDESVLLAGSSISEGKTSAAEKQNDEKISCLEVPLQLQSADGMDTTYEQPQLDCIRSDAERSQVPTKLDIVYETRVESGNFVGNTRGTLHTSAVREQPDSPNQINEQIQGMEQGSLTAASLSPQSLETSQTSRPELTHKRIDVAASTVEPRRKSGASSKLSISTLRLARQGSDAISERSRGQQDVSVITVGNGSGEVSTLWDTKGSDERRQRGLSGEASTSHSHATSPADSPAISHPISTSPSHQTPNEKETLESAAGAKFSESTCVSKPCLREDMCTSELDSVDTEEKPIICNSEKVCRKSLRQCAVRADIGKLSIANDTKLDPWSGAYKTELEAQTEPQAESYLKVAVNMSVTDIGLSKNGARSLLPVKVEEAVHCQNQGPLQNKSMEMLREGTHGEGSEGNGADEKDIATFQAITSPDTSEEVSQNEAINANSHQSDNPVKIDRHTPQAYAHPHLLQRMKEYQQTRNLKRNFEVCPSPDNDGRVVNESSSTHLPHPRSVSEMVNEENEESIKKQWKQLEAAEREGVLKLASEDEIEGEILVLQDALLGCAKENRGRCERLISNLIQQVADERAVSHRREQEVAFVQHYLSQAREAKKQGRKDRRDKEAQAVLAAATAAAAASPRLGYVKRDTSTNFDTDLSMPSLDTSIGYSPGLFSTSLRHSKPPVPKPNKPLITSVSPMLSGRSGTHARSNLLKSMTSLRPGGLRTGFHSLQTHGDTSSCDICSSGESSRVNRIVVCDSCKVTVHQECYGIGRFPFGLWLCQPCSELERSSHNPRLPEVDGQTTFWVQCALCCGRRGALKRSTDNRWVHVFCAQWMPGTSVGKDQAALIQGMENVAPDRFLLICSICKREGGACLTCNFGHCQGAFHPTCAREMGLYMSVKVGTAGRFQYQAYCDRHGHVQKAKDEQAEEKQRTRTEELHALCQIRVEFERVRLICERICRRERLKRDLLQASRDVSVAQLMYAGQAGVNDFEQLVVVEPFASQREVSLSAEHYINSKSIEDRIPDSKIRSGRKELHKRHKKFRKHGETSLLREKLMTPIEASMQNMRLPKGYAYVPVDVYVKGTIAATQSDLLGKELLRPTSIPSQLPNE